MRKFLLAACVAGLGIALSSATAASASTSAPAWAPRTIVIGPHQSIQAAVNAARPGDTVLLLPGVYHQSVQIRKDDITLRGSGAFRGGTVLVPPKKFPPTLCTQAFGNQLGIFVRHAHQVLVTDNLVSGNCQGILVLDDGQPGGAGQVTITYNRALTNNKFCPKSEETPALQGGGILLLGATRSLVAFNSVRGNSGKQINSGGIVVASAHALTHGSNPNFDTIVRNVAFRNHPADLIWDGSGIGVRFRANVCGTSLPPGLCH